MSASAAKKGRSHRNPVFIAKLEQMLKDTSIQLFFSWTRTSDCLHIKNVSKFTEQVLPKYFIHKNYSSFIRQLNMYGFHKIEHPQGENVYKNQSFKMGDRHQRRLCIRGKLANLKAGGKSERQNAIQGQLDLLNARQKNLEQLCNNMMRQNQRLVQGCQNLAYEYQLTLKTAQKRSQNFVLMLLGRRKEGSLAEGVFSTKQNKKPQAESKGQATEKEATQSESVLDVLSRNLKRSEHYAKVNRIKEHFYERMSFANGREQIPKVGTDQGNDIISEIRSEFDGIGDFDQMVSIELSQEKGFVSLNSYLDMREGREAIYFGQSS